MQVIVILSVLIAIAAAAPGNSRVVGGQDASLGQFPSTCSMQWGLITASNHMCGSSVINVNWVLSAAHCITEAPTIGVMDIVCGITNLNANEATLQRRRIGQTVLHESYTGGVAPHDIAVFRLASPLVLGAAVQAITLPAAGVVPSGNAILSGWGSTSTTNTPSLPSQMQWVEKPIIDMSVCAGIFGDNSPLYYNSNVCTGPLTGGVSACSGDSGGPLMQGNTQVGVVSWGVMPCGTVGAPSVYVQVSFYLAWIQNAIA